MAEWGGGESKVRGGWLLGCTGAGHGGWLGGWARSEDPWLLQDACANMKTQQAGRVSIPLSAFDPFVCLLGRGNPMSTPCIGLHIRWQDLRRL